MLREVSKYRSISELVKKSFPNLDPNFFRSPYARSTSKESVETHPYRENIWVYSACTAINTNILQIPWAFDERATEEQELITDHEFFTLLDNPNPFMDGDSFKETILLNLLLPTGTTKGGQCFLMTESNTGRPVSLSRGDIPAEIYPFNDSVVEPIVKNDMLIGWNLIVKDKKIPYSLDEVIRLHFVDPENPLRGQCPIYAAMSGLRQNSKSDTMNESFFDNNASLGGTLETDADIDADQAKELLKDFEETYSGADKTGKVALLKLGLKYQQFQRTHLDMQFLEQKKFSREEVAAAYRVPKAEMSLYEDINYATAISADRSFWNKTLMPLLNKIFKKFDNQWVKNIDNGRYVLKGDTSNVYALQVNFKEKLEEAKLLAEMHVPLKEINRRLELELEIDEYPWLSTSLVPFSLSPAEDIMEKEEPEVSDETEDEDEPTIESTIDSLKESIKKEEKKDRFNQHYNTKIIDPDSKKYRSLFLKYINGQRNRILDKIDAWANSNKSIKKDGDYDPALEVNPNVFMLDLKKEAFSLRKLMLPEYRRQIKREGEQMAEELDGLVGWKEDNPEIQRFLKHRMKQLPKINRLTFKRAIKDVEEVLKQAQNNNWNVNKTAKELKKAINKKYKEYSIGRSKVIARTETGITHMTTRHNVMKTEGYKKVEWITAADEKVRSAASDPPAKYPHDILHTETAGIEEGFNNGETIRFPLDPFASAGNIINCRCVHVVAKEK